MDLFGLLKRRRGAEVLVIGLDGVPHSFLSEQIARGELPNLAALAADGELTSARSTYPTVSCSAWTSFVTGLNPGGHGIFGFQDRRPGSYETFITGSGQVQAPALWRTLTERGRRVLIINVPVTYPPPQVSGLLVSGFLAPRLEGATHPPQLAARLERLGYRIDIDPWRARESLDALLDDLDLTLEARIRAATELLREERWSLAMVHIMGTDRINHFMWGAWESRDPEYAPRFLDYYRKVDGAVGRLMEAAGEQSEVLVLSDHGFCLTRAEVNLDAWLRGRGWLAVLATEGASLSEVDESTRAFSLTPGRIYLNVRGREPRGALSPGEEYESARDELAAELAELTDPETGEAILADVFKREEVFQGPAMAAASDLLAVPRDGYDLKSNLSSAELFTSGPITGMHTYDDAFWCARGRSFVHADPQVCDGAPTVLQLLGEDLPDSLDGRPMLQ